MPSARRAGGRGKNSDRPNPEASAPFLPRATFIPHHNAQRAKDAEAFGDKGLVVQLEDMVRDESSHAEETERMLRDWPI